MVEGAGAELTVVDGRDLESRAAPPPVSVFPCDSLFVVPHGDNPILEEVAQRVTLALRDRGTLGRIGFCPRGRPLPAGVQRPALVLGLDIARGPEPDGSGALSIAIRGRLGNDALMRSADYPPARGPDEVQWHRPFRVSASLSAPAGDASEELASAGTRYLIEAVAEAVAATAVSAIEELAGDFPAVADFPARLLPEPRHRAG